MPQQRSKNWTRPPNLDRPVEPKIAGLRPDNVLGPHRKTKAGEHQRKSIHAPTLSYESKIVEITTPKTVELLASKSKVINADGLITSLDKL